MLTFTVGVDESGRGCLAGSVFAGAVVLGSVTDHRVTDSKRIKKEEERNAIAKEIQTDSLAYSVEKSTCEDIDRVNILEASLDAMRRAIDSVYFQLLTLNTPFQLIALIDGSVCPYRKTEIPDYICQVRTIVGGDLKEKCIGAASILAKVAKDEEMRELHELYPMYEWDKNKSYGTKIHKEAIKKYGKCVYHRKSFKVSIT
jgi:ribonuclease HII